MRPARPPPLQDSGQGTNGDLRLHRGLVQSAPPPLRPRLSFTDQLRKDSTTTEFNRKPNTVHRSGVAPLWEPTRATTAGTLCKNCAITGELHTLRASRALLSTSAPLVIRATRLVSTSANGW